MNVTSRRGARDEGWTIGVLDHRTDEETAGVLLARARACHRDDDIAAADFLYRGLAVCFPADAEAWQGLALIRMEAEGGAAAVIPLLRALRCDNGERYRMWFHLGIAYLKLDRPDAAVMAFLKAIEAESAYENSYMQLLTVLGRGNRGQDMAEVYVALGRSRFRRGLPEAAMEAYGSALAIDPDYEPALLALAPLLRFYGRSDEAADAYGRILRKRPEDIGARLGLASARLRIIHSTADEVRQVRAAYVGEMARVWAQAADADCAALAAAEHAVGDCKPFYLNYHGLDDRDALRLYGQAVHKIMGTYLERFMVPLAVRAGAAGRKLKIGFISSFLYEHSVSKLFVGWAERLDRDRFEVFCYHLGAGSDSYTDRFRAGAVSFVQGLSGTATWAEAIRADDLDALIYLDIGMSGLEVRLAPLRLAPVQCVTWGHPVTTGFPNMDYFLSSALMEPFNGADHYTETLVALPNLSIHYEPILYDDEPLSRADLDLSESDVLFTCCQSLYKYLPQYDGVFSAIAERLPSARFLFLRHHLPEVTAVFEERMARAFAEVGLDAADHCRVLDRIPRDAFGSFLRCGDVYLDSIGWSGGNTTLEAMAHDRPVVTLAADLMRGRHSTGILRRLGLDDLITNSLGDYVERAVALGSDPAMRRGVSAHVAAHKHRLYRDEAPVHALETFLTRAVAARR